MNVNNGQPCDFLTRLQANVVAIHEFGKELEGRVSKLQYLAVLLSAAYASGVVMLYTGRPIGAEALLPVSASGGVSSTVSASGGVSLNVSASGGVSQHTLVMCTLAHPSGAEALLPVSVLGGDEASDLCKRS